LRGGLLPRTGSLPTQLLTTISYLGKATLKLRYTRAPRTRGA